MSLLPSGTEYVCDKCGFIEHNMVEVDVEHHGVSSNAAVPMRIQGPRSQKHQRKLTGQTSDYRIAQKRATLEQMIAYVHRYQGNKVPMNVIEDAAKYYYAMQERHIIKRGSVREGIMASCMYRKCREYGVARKPKEIIAIFGVSQSELSQGEKILDDLHARGLLPRLLMSSEEAQARSFVVRYLEALRIPKENETFATRLVRFTIKYNIAESSITSSKCAGAIYFLAEKYKDLNITREQIAAKCAISKSTFIRFHGAICAVLADKDPLKKPVRARLRQIFKRNQVPLPLK